MNILLPAKPKTRLLAIEALEGSKHVFDHLSLVTRAALCPKLTLLMLRHGPVNGTKLTSEQVNDMYSKRQNELIDIIKGLK